MGSVSTAMFCKRKTCPSAEMLLLYHDGVLASAFEREIAAHLAACDFCDAELYLLTKFPPAGLPSYTPAAIPAAFYQLMKNLLTAGPRVVGRTLKLICDNDQLTFTDA
jgi:hypothetical protein